MRFLSCPRQPVESETERRRCTNAQGNILILFSLSSLVSPPSLHLLTHSQESYAKMSPLLGVSTPNLHWKVHCETCAPVDLLPTRLNMDSVQALSRHYTSRLSLILSSKQHQSYQLLFWKCTSQLLPCIPCAFQLSYFPLHHLLVAYPSQVPCNRFLQLIPKALLPRASPIYAWITSLAASIRTRN